MSDEKSGHCTGDGHGHRHGDHSSCCTTLPAPSVAQNLDEMQFERGIWQAAIDNNVQKIERLIRDQKVHPDAPDAYGYTALHYAVRNSAFDATKYLVDAGANVNCQTKNNQTTPLHRAIMTDKPENLKIIQYLCTHGANTHLTDSDGLNPLERAKEKHIKSENCTQIIELLEKYSQKY